MESIQITVSGISPLLLNNPQTVDRFNKYAKAMAQINAKKTRRTDADYLELRDIEIRSKIYFDDDIGIYIPGTWVTSAIGGHSFSVAKIGKGVVRGAVFVSDSKIKLNYSGQNKVSRPSDIVKNDKFHHLMNLKQGQVRVVKNFPIFHDWSFSTEIEFDDTIIDKDSMVRIIEHASKYGGFGDFRPTFGRASVEVE